MKKRVVITGLGVVAPNGIGKDEFWQANIHGKSGVDTVTLFDISDCDTKIAAQVKDFDPLKYMPKEVARKVDRFVHYGLASAAMAIDDSWLNLEKEDKERIGVIIGSGLGGLLFHEEQIATVIAQAYNKEKKRYNPLCVPRISPNAVASHIAIQFGLRGANMVISTACASGSHAIGQALRLIQSGDLELAVAGGAEASLTEFTFRAYSALRVLSKRNDAPQEASRPFDADRDGFVLGEGAAMLILEELEHALNRGVHIYAEIIGYGANSGAYHMVMPKEDGIDVANAMLYALADGGVRPEEVDYINAHGTSTTANDRAETRAVKIIFGEHAYKVPISSTKSMIGHTIGAAGAIEAVVSALTIDRQIIPPTINYRTKDPECDLYYVPNEAVERKVDIVLSNSFGFGNTNACIVLKRYTE
jgi:3-oxoacyl-[acyl-carrier-protein] synthase II